MKDNWLREGRVIMTEHSLGSDDCAGVDDHAAKAIANAIEEAVNATETELAKVYKKNEELNKLVSGLSAVLQDHHRHNIELRRVLRNLLTEMPSDDLPDHCSWDLPCPVASAREAKQVLDRPYSTTPR